MDDTAAIPEELVEYLAARDQKHANAVTRTLAAMTEREQHLVREAAIMGYVRGNMAGRCGDFKVPKDSAVLHEVIDACHAFEDLYPVINGLATPTKENP